jgi:hypothetical protein
VTIRVADANGQTMFTAERQAASGLQRVIWNLRAADAGGRGGGRGGGAPVPSGKYTLTLESGGLTLTRPATVKPPVMLPRISGAGGR